MHKIWTCTKDHEQDTKSIISLLAQSIPIGTVLSKVNYLLAQSISLSLHITGGLFSQSWCLDYNCVTSNVFTSILFTKTRLACSKNVVIQIETTAKGHVALIRTQTMVSAVMDQRWGQPWAMVATAILDICYTLAAKAKPIIPLIFYF